jgi:hypothetical protein
MLKILKWVKLFSSLRRGGGGVHATESVISIDLQKSIPTQIRHLISYVSNNEGHDDGFVRELTLTDL